MKTRVIVASIIFLLAILGGCGLVQAQTVEFSATLQAYPYEYFQTGWAFGGTSEGSSAWFYYSAFGEPANDIIAVETPVVVLQATAIGVGATIQSIKLELVITEEFYLTKEIVCEGVIHL